MNTTTPSFLGTNKKTARIAGAFYLLFIVATAIANAIRTKFIVDGDAIATARNIQDSEMLFRFGFLSDILAGVLFLLAAWALYVLLKPVNKNIALLFLVLNLGGVAVQCLNMLNLFSAVLLLSGAEYLTIFQPNQLQVLAMLFLNLHESGFMIAQFFFAAWLFPLGYLVFRSGYLPRILGIVVMVECFAWLLYPLQFFLFPSVFIAYLSSAIGFIGEFSLTLWLLIMGAKDQKPALAEVK
jgi:hypothetical protein